MTWPFHEGETRVQERAGAHGMAARVGNFVRTAMPDQHRELFAKLPYLVLGTLDADQRPFATMVVGEPGFIETPDATTLRVHATLDPNDPARAGIQPGAPIGVLGIELSTRRRNRANGTVVRTEQGLFEVHVEQSTGNCPQYIQSRSIERTAHREGVASREGKLLSSDALVTIAHADTTFVATASSEIHRDGIHGCDVSHRGGKPGFWRAQTIDGQTRLSMPDFAGNYFFMTLGNLELNPKIGVSFVDFANGNWLALTGRAQVQWDGDEVRAFEGAERLLHLDVDDGMLLRGMIPFAWSSPTYAKQLSRTGQW